LSVAANFDGPFTFLTLLAQLDAEWLVEHRFRTVMEVLDGAPVAEVFRERIVTARRALMNRRPDLLDRATPKAAEM
jgi:hypothetical protein